ncbi:hypothetical protein [Burkholderia ubonensis]|uniref:hypothetical protein n=1 Tax=Burkholderia ubonensis TaxID=101571 RepID=UPI00076CBAF6|nr:hypothetical protein [Burkholderia ubonensis]KVW45992.1 hypothetical protein WK95_07740 [Burkholderia ubonensis]
MVEATREIGAIKTIKRRHDVCLTSDAARIAQVVRARWRIENSTQWVLGMPDSTKCDVDANCSMCVGARGPGSAPRWNIRFTPSSDGSAF